MPRSRERQGSTEGARPPSGGDAAARRPDTDIRGLLQRREYIKTTAYILPRATKMHILALMDRLREARRPAKDRRAGPPPRLPEMTGGELVREINWRIGTLPPADAVAVAEYVKRLTAWRRARARRR